MIGYLTGTIHAKSQDYIIVLVSGVGYNVTIPAHYAFSLKEREPVELFIYTHVREDALDLYGFFSPDELTLFKLVLSVSGIGPKTALLVIDRGAPSVEQAIKDASIEFFTTIPRLGRKNAQKIIIELKSKLGGLKELNLASQSEEARQAVEALRAMGYTKQEAQQAIESVPASEQTVERKISFALRQLGKAKMKQ